MSKNPLKTIVTSLIKPIIEELGYELVDVEYKNPGGPWKLTIFIYKQGGVNFEDCELVSKTIDPVLGTNKDVTDRYDFLQVSSPGIDREFKCLADYERYISKKIEISLYAPVNGKKKITGVLIKANEDKIAIEDESGIIELKLSEIGKAALAIEF